MMRVPLVLKRSFWELGYGRADWSQVGTGSCAFLTWYLTVGFLLLRSNRHPAGGED
jgi:hypothetical protein